MEEDLAIAHLFFHAFEDVKLPTDGGSVKVGKGTGGGDSAFCSEGPLEGAEVHQGVGGDVLDLEIVSGQHGREEI